MLIYMNFKFNFLIKYHLIFLILEEYECSHQDVSQVYLIYSNTAIHVVNSKKAKFLDNCFTKSFLHTPVQNEQ
jgi:hypothetical protein